MKDPFSLLLLEIQSRDFENEKPELSGGASTKLSLPVLKKDSFGNSMWFLNVYSFRNEGKQSPTCSRSYASQWLMPS